MPNPIDSAKSPGEVWGVFFGEFMRQSSAGLFGGLILPTIFLISCGGGGSDSTLFAEQEAALRGFWSGDLSLVSDQCFGAEQTFDAQFEIEADGGDSLAIFTLPEGSVSPQTELDTLEGEVLDQGGLSASAKDGEDTCFRCATVTLEMDTPVFHAGTICCSELGCSASCPPKYYSSNARYIYTPRNGSGGCSVTWEGEVTRILP